MEGEARSPGIIASVRALAATLVDIAGTRAELALVELREEGARQKRIVATLAIAAVFLVLALLLAAFFVIACFWDTHRLAAIAGMTLLYGAVGAIALARATAASRSAPPPFEATLRELAADRDALRGARE